MKSMHDKREQMVEDARNLFRPVAAKHGLTIHGRMTGSYIELGFNLQDSSGAVVLAVYPYGYSWKAPRLEASGPVLPARRGRGGRVTHAMWRASPRALLDACQPYLRGLSHVEQFERSRKAFMSLYNMPVYRGPKYSNPTFTEMKAALIGSHRSIEDISVSHGVTENLKHAHERELSDELMYWLIDTSFTPELERAKALDAE